ncbi:MAG: hypothetical protein MUC78_07165 [Bacteroidales bacterium]|jgi:hypothetical protein|nr:hypothetical protein [Bacteroidales bacterium]
MKRVKLSGIKWSLLLCALIAVLFLAGCADAVNIKQCVTEEPAGFLNGLWHGIIAPVSFFVSLFKDSVAIYAVNNNGGFYDLGFVIGAGILFGGGGRASRRS